ncbi:MAG TPA: hypothetical protein VMU08_02135 [Rhizomicrobium sp.]|nr:hypothetical protein [Rhizomicrobium sp.]
MTNMESGTDGLATRLLTWAMIAGAALMLLEVTLAPAQPVTKTATVETTSVASIASHDRLARD